MSGKPQFGRVSVSTSVVDPDCGGLVPVAAERLASTAAPALITVRETAALLNLSISWVRRHLSELPVTRWGRLLRIDSTELQHKIENGKSLKSERVNMTPRRYQRGSIIWKQSKKGKDEVAYGVYRIDVVTANGIERRQKKVRLGTRKELVTDSKVRTKLDSRISADEEAPAAPTTPEKMNFGELAEKWKASEGPGLTKPTFDRYTSVLRAWLLPFWKDRSLESISRNDVQLFLNSKAGSYSKSSIRAMRLVLQLTLSFAHLNRWIENYPCIKLRTPRITNQSRTVTRAEMTEQEKLSISARVTEPVSTLVLLLTRLPLRIEEAIGIKKTDFENHVLTLRRVVYEGRTYELDQREQRRIPIMDKELLARLQKLGSEREWVFQSRVGTPLNPNNLRRRFLKPAAKELGIRLHGFHDFRFSLAAELRRGGTHPKVISDLLGHKKVNLAMDAYDRSNLRDFEEALSSTVMGSQLLPQLLPKTELY